MGDWDISLESVHRVKEKAKGKDFRDIKIKIKEGRETKGKDFRDINNKIKIKEERDTKEKDTRDIKIKDTKIKLVRDFKKGDLGIQTKDRDTDIKGFVSNAG